ncbi:MAG: tripartite tricarboxylate transporter substrate-binding protein [Burkholderiales bacterium]
MTLSMWRLIFTGVLVGAISATQAQDKYPNKPLQLYVPITPGATVDILARLAGDKLTQRLGQPVAIINRPGAGGTIAADAVLKAGADGHTLFYTNSQHSISARLLPNLPFDAVRDFSGVVLLADAPSVLGVSAQMGVRTLREFLELARKQPGVINYAGAAPGSATHMAGTDFANYANIRLTYVAYTGGSLIPDLISNRIQAMFAPVAFLMPQIKEGKLLALAITSPEAIRSPIVAPAAAEAGLPGYSYTTWYGVLASSKVPRPILTRLADELQRVSDEPDIREKLAAQGILPRKIALAEFDKFILADMERMGALIKANNIKPE